MKKLYMAAAICAILFTAGCAPSAEPVVQTVKYARHVTSAVPDVTVEQILNEYNSSRKTVELSTDTDAPYAPLAVVGCACRIGDSYILFPKVDCAAEEIINTAICTAVAERAKQLDKAVFADYQVEYNRNGIFSIRMFLYDMYGDNETCIDCIPLTFNSETGKIYRISDFFDSENQNWRGRIPDIITAQAADCRMVLLSDVMPISDDRPFYITDEAVVIMYDLYEIATYSAGEPEFQIPVDDIAECLDDTSVLNSMLPVADAEDEGEQEKEGEAQTEDTVTETEAAQPEQEQKEQEQPAGTENPQDTEDMTEQPQEDAGQEKAEPAAVSEEDEMTAMEEVQ